MTEQQLKVERGTLTARDGTVTEVIAVRSDLFTALAFEFSELDECETVARELLRLAAQWREQAEREALK